MPVAVRNEYRNRTPIRPIVRAIRATLVHEGAEPSDVSVLLTDDVTIRDLNRRYRHRDEATDVLSFPQQNWDAPSQASNGSVRNPCVLGDIVISVDTAARQARGRQVALGAELAHLAAHGALHLLGYDDQTESDYQEMVAREAIILRSAFGEVER